MRISESPLKATYDDQGYVLVPDLIPLDLLPTLHAACDRVIAKTRTGAWPHRRTVGKQFPPFDDTNPDSWGVQHVMHPALGEPVFAQWYTSEGVRAVSAALLGCETGVLQMGACVCVASLGVRGPTPECRAIQFIDQPAEPRFCASMAS